MNCHCGNIQNFASCCQIFIEEKDIPKSAEQLMRSRFTAFKLRNMDYIWKTHDPQTIQDLDKKGTTEWAMTVSFTKLEVLETSESGNKAFVKFNAYYTDQNNQPQVHKKHSLFRKQAGQWYYRSSK